MAKRVHLPRLCVTLLAGVAIAPALSGCVSNRSSGPWTWSPDATLQFRSVQSRVQPANAVIQPARGFRVVQGDTYASEYSRRDEQLGVRYESTNQSWMGWPNESRPTLDSRGSYYTSRDAHRYSYPRHEQSRSDGRRSSRRRHVR